jgi:hypothetical protein
MKFAHIDKKRQNARAVMRVNGPLVMSLALFLILGLPLRCLILGKDYPMAALSAVAGTAMFFGVWWLWRRTNER